MASDNKSEALVHPFEPVYDRASRVLIVGSFPSVQSRKLGFYYGNPRNRFWRVVADLCNTEIPETISQKKAFLLQHGIAVFDVLMSCEIHASSDASITEATPNDFTPIFTAAPDIRVFANGRTAYQYFYRFVRSDVTYLPSTSPANAAWNLSKLEEAWRILLPYLH